MIPPAPGPDDSSRLFGYATPPDGAGPIGHDQAWPQKLTVSRLEMLNSLNPIHHIPIVGSLYRAATGQRVPMTVRVVGAGLVAGPIGAFSVVLEGFVDALIRMGPDRTRPAVPAGMSETGSEQGVQPVTPGTLTPGQYLTLATEPADIVQRPAPASASDEDKRQARLAWERNTMVGGG